jgi:hypothetical protein
LLVFCLAAQRLAMLRAPFEFEFSSQHCFVFASYLSRSKSSSSLTRLPNGDVVQSSEILKSSSRGFSSSEKLRLDLASPALPHPVFLAKFKSESFLSYRKNTLTRSHLRFRRDSMSGPLKRTKMKCSPSRSTLGCMISLF